MLGDKTCAVHSIRDGFKRACSSLIYRAFRTPIRQSFGPNTREEYEW